MANEICSILGVEEQQVEDKVAFVNCNGHCDAVTKVAKYEGIGTCHAASMLYGGTSSCRFGCLGLGDCAGMKLQKVSLDRTRLYFKINGTLSEIDAEIAENIWVSR